jgi:hypothetical protein
MKKIIEYRTESGESILLECSADIDSDKAGMKNVAGFRQGIEIVESSETSINSALNTVSKFGGLIIEELKKIKPNKAEVEFGFKINAKGNFIVASGETEANFNIKLTWED